MLYIMPYSSNYAVWGPHCEPLKLKLVELHFANKHNQYIPMLQMTRYDGLFSVISMMEM